MNRFAPCFGRRLAHHFSCFQVCPIRDLSPAKHRESDVCRSERAERKSSNRVLSPRLQTLELTYRFFPVETLLALLAVRWRPNGTTDWRLKRYQLIPHPRLSSDGRLSSLKANPRVPHGESTGDGQILCNQQLTYRWLFRAADRGDARSLPRGGSATFAPSRAKQYRGATGSRWPGANRV